MTQILTLSRVRKSYDGKAVLHDVTLGFLPGAKVGVVGPNGTGIRAALPSPRCGRGRAVGRGSSRADRPGAVMGATLRHRLGGRQRRDRRPGQRLARRPGGILHSLPACRHPAELSRSRRRPTIRSAGWHRLYAPGHRIYARRQVRRRGSPSTAVTANGPCLFIAGRRPHAFG